MSEPILIIAEAGVNHNGSIELAKKLIDVAVKAGVDFIKFQTFKASSIASKNAPKAAYQEKDTEIPESQLEMLKKLELSKNAYIELINYCKSKNIEFISTPFDIESIDLLYELGIPVFKIASGEITNLQLLRKIGGLNREVILSTGMADLKEIGEALEVLKKAGTPKNKITVLHCNTEYPTPIEDVNLLAMQTIAKAFGVRTGYSDHTVGIEVPVAAVALGAKVIEKHFTLDRSLPGPDHKASLEPPELIAMVKAIRNIEKALGNGKKVPSESEMKNIVVARKSIHAAKPLRKGHKITIDDIIIKRPGDGISAMKYDWIIGKVMLIDCEEDYKLELSDIK